MKQEEIAEKIISMERAALEAWNAGNPSGYLDIYAPDFTYFDPMLERRLDSYDKIKELYEGIRGTVKVDKYEMINPVVQATDSMAVLSYNLISNAGDTLWKWNCTEVYRQCEDGNWKIVHNHWSLTKPE